MRRSGQKARYVADDMMMLAGDMSSLRNMLPKGQSELRDRLDRLASALNEEAEAVYRYATENP